MDFDFILIILTVALLFLNWGIYTRLSDAKGMTKNLQLQLVGSKESVYLVRLYKNMIASSCLFIVVIIAILMFLPVMYRLANGLALLPIVLILNFILLVVLGDQFVTARLLWRRSESYMSVAQTINGISALCTAMFLINAF